MTTLAAACLPFACVVFAVVSADSIFHIPPGHPFTPAVKIMLALTALSALFAGINLVLKGYSHRKMMEYLRRAQENDENARQILQIVRERVVQTREHRRDVAETLVRVGEKVGEVKDVVEQTGEEIVQAVQQAVFQPQPKPEPESEPESKSVPKSDPEGTR